MLTLPTYDGQLAPYALQGDPLVPRAPRVPLTRTAFAAAHAVTDHEHALLRESGVLVVFAPKTHVTGHRDTDGACGHDAFPFLRVRLTCVVCGFAACPFDSIATLFRESRVRILLKRGKEASIALRNWSTPVQYVVAWPDSMSCPENVA